jgi:lipopolysaccharide export LptBFGC system permease protein LptF
MTRPGDRLRALAARVFDAQTMERLVDPVVADLQVEHGDALRAGRMWRSRWVWVAGYVAFAKIFGACGLEGSMRGLQHLRGDERLILSRIVGFSLAAVVLLTLVLEAPSYLFGGFYAHVTLARSLVYLTPQVLTVSIPMALTIGVVYGLRNRRIATRLVVALLTIAMVCSVASFAMSAWAVPASNEAFRVWGAQRFGGVSQTRRGINELSLGELSRQIESSRHGAAGVLGDVRVLAFTYHYRWALSCAPLVLALLALSIAARRRVGRLTMGVAAFCVFLSYYVLLFGGRALALTGVVPAYAGAWLPNAIVILIAASVAMIHRAVSGRPEGLHYT